MLMRFPPIADINLQIHPAQLASNIRRVRRGGTAFLKDYGHSRTPVGGEAFEKCVNRTRAMYAPSLDRLLTANACHPQLPVP